MDRPIIVEWSQGWGMPQINRFIAGGPLTLAGRVFERGSGTHAYSVIRIRSDRPLRGIRAVAGLDDKTGPRFAPANFGSPKRLMFSIETSGREVCGYFVLGAAARNRHMGSRMRGIRLDTYRVRSACGPAFQFSFFPYAYTSIRDDYNRAWHRRMLVEYRRARPLFYGDYYPLTPASPAKDA